MLIAVFVIPMVMYLASRHINKTTVMTYMSGANTGNNKFFINSFGKNTRLFMTNWYMEDLFGEKRLLKTSLILATAVLVVAMCVMAGGVLK
jgi:ech hydrogenase subunit A